MAPGAPLGWVVFSLTLVLFIRVWAPRWMEHRKPYALRPWTLVINGFLLGAYTLAVLTSMVLTALFTKSFDCESYNKQSRDLVEIALKHASSILKRSR